MRQFLFMLALLIAAPLSAQAQNENLDIVQEPICFNVVNQAPYSIYGKFTTAQFTRPDGIVTRHRSNFKLEEPGTTDPETGAALDRAEFCSYGPFMPDRQLELMLRSLVPLFACKTRVDQGDIVIKGFRKPEGGTKTWAECFAPNGTKIIKPPED